MTLPQATQHKVCLKLPALLTPEKSHYYKSRLTHQLLELILGTCLGPLS